MLLTINNPSPQKRQRERTTFSVGSSVLPSSGNEKRIRSTKLVGPPAILAWPCAAIRENRHLDGYRPRRSKGSERKNQRLSKNRDIREGL